MEGKYIATIKVSKKHPMEWRDVKERLAYQVGQELFPKMIDSGEYHVCKFDIVRRDCHHPFFDDYFEYSIIAHLSVAKQQTIYLSKMEKLTVEYKGEQYTRVCKYCGNALMLDMRGGCSACGAPNGGYK